MRQLVLMPDPTDGGDQAACDQTARLGQAPCKNRVGIAVPEQYGQRRPRGFGQRPHDRLIGGVQSGHAAPERADPPAGSRGGDLEATVPDRRLIGRQGGVGQPGPAGLAGDEEGPSGCLDASACQGGGDLRFGCEACMKGRQAGAARRGVLS